MGPFEVTAGTSSVSLAVAGRAYSNNGGSTYALRRGRQGPTLDAERLDGRQQQLRDPLPGSGELTGWTHSREEQMHQASNGLTSLSATSTSAVDVIWKVHSSSLWTVAPVLKARRLGPGR